MPKLKRTLIDTARETAILLDGRYVVSETRWFGTPEITVYDFDVPIMGANSSLRTFDGEWCGTVRSRALPVEIEALPGWRHPGHEKRVEAVHAWRAQLRIEAESAVRTVFGDDAIARMEW